MTPLRPGLPELPPRMTALPRDARGYPVPWFVAWVAGPDGIKVPDFRIVNADKLLPAWQQQLCWLCGQRLGAFKAFVIGPMCAINRISSEPPSHLECALFAARSCPFLTRPHAQRRGAGIPDDSERAAGEGLRHNPGACLVWVSRKPELVRVRANPRHNIQGGLLFDVGEPISWHWFCQGREATLSEITDAVARGLPKLRSLAEKEGPMALKEFDRLYQRALPVLLPAAA